MNNYLPADRYGFPASFVFCGTRLWSDGMLDTRDDRVSYEGGGETLRVDLDEIAELREDSA